MEKYALALDAPEIVSSMTPDLSIIIISTNEGKWLEDCLCSVFKNQVEFECFVFNNASTDSTAHILKKYACDRLVPIYNDAKRGFIENNNEGIQRAKGRYVLLLNPDTIVQPDTFRRMIEFMDTHPDAAVSTCRLVYRDGSPQPHCRRFPTPISYFFRLSGLDKLFPHHWAVRKYLMSDIDFNINQKVDWFITAFFFMRKTVIDKMGPLDKRLLQPFYCEDLEWCTRSKRRGYENYFVATTTIIHDYQQTSRKKIGRLTLVHLCNILIYFSRHGWSLLTGRVKSV